MKGFSFSTFSVLVEHPLRFYEFFFSLNFSLQKKWVSNIFNVSLFRSVQRILRLPLEPLLELQYPQFQILLSLVFIQKITKTVSAICFIKIVSCKKKIKVALVRNCHSFKWNNYSFLGKYSAVHFQTTYFVVHIT